MKLLIWIAALSSAVLTGSQAGAGRWEKLAPLPELPRYYSGVAAARGQLFVVGGVAIGKADGPERVAAHAYDPRTGRWTSLPQLPGPAVMPNLAGVGDQLFVLGARDMNTSWSYDFASGRWNERKPLPVAMLGSAAVGVHGTTVFLAGGIVPGRSSNNLNTGVRQSTFLAYHSVEDRWEALPNIPVAVAYAAGAVIENQFWMMGGSTNTARTGKVLVYDIPARQWSERAALPVSLSSAAFGAIGNRIYVTGGIATDSGEISAETRVLESSTGEWTTVAALPTPRFAMHGAAIDGRLYVPGGLGMNGEGRDAVPAVRSSLEVFIP